MNRDPLMDFDIDRDGWNPCVWGLVACIPCGKVATYGQLAAILGFPRRSRHVGFALKATPKELELPWFRVINSSGAISLPHLSDGYWRQRTLLESEGIVFLHSGKVDLRRFGWKP